MRAMRGMTLLHSTASRVADHPTYDPKRDGEMSISSRFDLALAGDIVMTRPVSLLQDPSVRAALKPFKDADFAFGNLEQSIGDWRSFEGHHYGVFAFLIMADPRIARDLAEIGFDCLGRANNRLSDFGNVGNRETDRHLRAAGITPVGYGEHLAAARAPAYVDTPKGRIATLSVTAHVNHAADAVFGPAARVGLSNGRPGANNLRIGRTIRLRPDAYDALKTLALENDYAFPGPFVIMPTVNVFEDRLRIGTDWYVPSETPGYSYRIHPDDERDVLRHVKTAAAFSNFTILAVHSHQWEIDPNDPKGGIAGEMPTPPAFLKDFAHKAIDAGVDVFTVAGPFDFRAIEIYRGKPIFYGLGSFVRQPYMQEVVPHETYRRFEFGPMRFDAVDPHDTDIPDVELLLTRTAKHPSSYFEGAIPTCHYEDGRLQEIALQPIDLGFDGPLSDLGIPRISQADQAKAQIDEIAQRCAPFGTLVTQDGTVGRIHPQTSGDAP